MAQLTKESFLAGAKFIIKGNVYQYLENRLCFFIGLEVYEIYNSVVSSDSFIAVDLFFGDFITKEIKFSECTLYEK